MIEFFARLLRPVINTLVFLTPIADLAARLWVAQIFFRAGLLKINSWPSTVALFQTVFKVPLLSPHIAAVIGTGAELVLPVLLVIGLGGRIMILIFFCYNVIAVVSYPFLLTPDGAQGLAQHVNWGLLLGLLMCHGPGKLSLDYLIKQRHGHLLDKK